MSTKREKIKRILDLSDVLEKCYNILESIYDKDSNMDREFVRKMKIEIRAGALEALMIELYNENFDETMIDAALKFWESNDGKKFMDIYEDILQKFPRKLSLLMQTIESKVKNEMMAEQEEIENMVYKSSADKAN